MFQPRTIQGKKKKKIKSHFYSSLNPRKKCHFYSAFNPRKKSQFEGLLSWQISKLATMLRRLHIVLENKKKKNKGPVSMCWGILGICCYPHLYRQIVTGLVMWSNLLPLNFRCLFSVIFMLGWSGRYGYSWKKKHPAHWGLAGNCAIHCASTTTIMCHAIWHRCPWLSKDLSP